MCQTKVDAIHVKWKILFLWDSAFPFLTRVSPEAGSELRIHVPWVYLQCGLMFCREWKDVNKVGFMKPHG